jgi:hypothetical protein
LSPIQIATRDQPVDRRPARRSYAPADVLFTLPNDVMSEIVVDWQLPSDKENRRRF